jgi:GNAT superfamily N-acetyltransferase
MSTDLIYRMQRTLPYATTRSGFGSAETAGAGLKVFPAILHERGMVGTAKLVIKLGLRRCLYFFLTDNGRIVSTGVLTYGRYGLHEVSREAIVIGEIATRPDARGKGFATQAIMLAINLMVRRGACDFYIDTQPENGPMLRSIEKLGFGAPIAELRRGGP